MQQFDQTNYYNPKRIQWSVHFKKGLNYRKLALHQQAYVQTNIWHVSFFTLASLIQGKEWKKSHSLIASVCGIRLVTVAVDIFSCGIGFQSKQQQRLPNKNASFVLWATSINRGSEMYCSGLKPTPRRLCVRRVGVAAEEAPFHMLVTSLIWPRGSPPILPWRLAAVWICYQSTSDSSNIGWGD